tara:strand:- start:4367 stop:4954 length:588 start_codon:yes stop_codon:yes gene_type:complete
MIVFSCRDSINGNQKNDLVYIQYGKWSGQNESLAVTLDLDNFKDYPELLNRTEEIACQDSLPKIVFRTGDSVKDIYFHNPCWKDYACILLKQRNQIEIHNDTIFKGGDLIYPLDSLKQVLRKNLENFGKNPTLAESPEKLLIHISYDSLKPEKLRKTLDELTTTYTQITDSTNINIWLKQRIKLLPPPPPEVTGS